MPTETRDGLVRRFTDTIQQRVCGFFGHELLRVFETERIFLRCMSCGHETPGWDLPSPHISPGPLESIYNPTARKLLKDQSV